MSKVPEFIPLITIIFNILQKKKDDHTKDDLEKLKYCIKNIPDKDINKYDNKGKRILYYLCIYGYVELTKIMLSKDDCDYKSCDAFLLPPLFIACKKRDNQEMIKFLISHPKIDVNAKDACGYTALHEACDNNNLEAVKILLNHKDVLPDIRGKNDGYTPFLIACIRRNSEDIIRLFLCDDRINIYARADGHRNALAIARLVENDKIEAILKNDKRFKIENSIN